MNKSSQNASRRKVLGSSVAAIATGLMAPVIATAHAAAPSADAELIALAAAMAKAHAWTVAHNAFDEDGLSEDQANALYDAACGVDRAWWGAAERIEAIPATTSAGVRAKASALRMAIQRMVIQPCAPISDAEYHERLAYALAADILAGSAAT
jgi:hypothetical protein